MGFGLSRENGGLHQFIKIGRKDNIIRRLRHDIGERQIAHAWFRFGCHVSNKRVASLRLSQSASYSSRCSAHTDPAWSGYLFSLSSFIIHCGIRTYVLVHWSTKSWPEGCWMFWKRRRPVQKQNRLAVYCTRSRSISCSKCCKVRKGTSIPYRVFLLFPTSSPAFDHFFGNNDFLPCFRFLYKGIIINHNKTEPAYTKTSLFLCEKATFFLAGFGKE